MKRVLVPLAALALAAPVQAAGPWSAPVDVGPPSDYVEAPQLTFSPAGTGLVGWLVRIGGQPGGDRRADSGPQRWLRRPDRAAWL
jgi:hypothetical protein